MNRFAFVFLIGLIAHASFAQDMPLSQVLVDGENWQVVSEGHRFTDGLAVDKAGNLYFADVLGGTTIHRITPAGKIADVVVDVPRISGLHLGSNGKLYACQGGDFGRILSIELESGTATTLAEGFRPNDLVAAPSGDIYFTETPKKRVVRVSPTGTVSVASLSEKSESGEYQGPIRPNGIALTPDFGTLAVSDHGGKHTWVWRIESSGALSFRQPYITLRTPAPDAPSKGDGMTTDAVGRYYVTTAVGIQMFDPTGRMGGVIAKPSDQPIVSVAFAGEGLSYLYVAAGDKIYRRKTKTKGWAP